MMFAPRPMSFLVLAALAISSAAGDVQARDAGSFADVIPQAQTKIVKIYGAGKIAGLEAYQTGVVVSADGQILTVFSYVLDTDDLLVLLDDGRRFTAKLLGADPRLEIALLKIDARALPHFNLAHAAKASAGDRVLGLSNLFNVATGGEAASAHRGVISAKTPLAARRGSYKTPYTGPVYVVDAMTNNPGAAGGALVNRRGEFLGLLGKELRNSQTNIWLNYAIPAEELTRPVADLAAGRGSAKPSSDVPKPAQPHDLARLGIVLVPDIVARTPPFVDFVRPGTSAAAAGVKPDDLILLVGDQLVSSCNALREQVGRMDRIDTVRLTVMRGQDLVELSLQSPRSESK